MTWENREGRPAEEQLKDLKQEFSIENINPEILTEFPGATQRARLFLVSSGGLWLQLNFGGSRYRVQLSSF